MGRRLRDLSEQEILALAMTLEEEDARIYDDVAEGLAANFPGTAKIFIAMRDEEAEHRRRLAEQYRVRFGEHIPHLRREDIRGFVQRKPVWLTRPLGIEAVRRLASTMELETRQFYERAAAQVTHVPTRELLLDLAATEKTHIELAERLNAELSDATRAEEAAAGRRLFVLQVVQPGLAGLMDGSVSTLAPLFAAAFATHNAWDAFRVGLAASVGAGISMGFAEALSDDGSMTGRGKPLLRGVVTGTMTFAGGIGHTLPYLISDFRTATTLAVAVVAVELVTISAVRNRYMDTPFLSAAFQVIVGGVLVFLAGILIGSS